ncbi:UDP-N-acetylglucosamine 2-epimerase [Aerococcus urinaeequi]|uniref:UDP-N-acetylglucosamine 2-epimerase n=1 Tax=Aerococcus urinaeequi TaxID=51665 RepID=A0AAF0BJ34_9LACT|nr:UDP-N-acetylglucosamine 2-epimerase [Aerococcus urinaeequi]WCG37230.1 UDP-N-acetylglucosamine 2-epimerase [Aerococcus urinaeequi]
MKKICVVTGTRSEYGLLYPLIKRFYEDEEVELQLIVTGTHLSPEFGMTVKLIEFDGFPISERIEILLSSDTAVGISKSIGLGMISFGEAYERLQPDMIVLLGDRFEMLAASIAALISKIPISHIHGGELTEGAYDDSIRHSITKMSTLHFTSTEEYRKRVIQLGESPERVYNVGALGIENIRNMELLTKEELSEKLKFKIDDTLLLVTYHPVTLEKDSSVLQFEELLKALEDFKGTIFFTRANADNGGRAINKMLDEFVNNHSNKVKAFSSMGQLQYLSAMKSADIVIGNSSSGIIEAPSFKVPTINIGNRQKGRIQSDSVINASCTQQDINQAIKLALSKSFKEKVNSANNPYEKDNVVNNISLIIKKALKNSLSIKKQFFDIEM